MEKKRNIFFRADGSSRIGLGHIIRSLALVEMLSTEFTCHFITRNPSVFLSNLLEQQCDTVVELPAGMDLLEEAHFVANEVIHDQAILVLDGYHFETTYQRIVKKSVDRLICIDDIYQYHFVADAIINHAGGITAQLYSAEPFTRFYLGLDYILLRRPFREAAKSRMPITQREEAIFICLGGADPKNDLWEVLQVLRKKISKEKIYIVVGSAYLHREELEQKLADQWKGDYEILSNLSAVQMVDYMQRCPVAITSPSSVSYEYLSVGGVLYLHLIADNQKDMLAYLTKNKLALHFRQYPQEEVRKELEENQRKYLDGDQAKRLLEIFKN